MLSALFALVSITAMVISFINLYRSRRDLARAEKNLVVVKAAYRRRITVRGPGIEWTKTLAEICDGPPPDSLALPAGGRVLITTDPERKTV